MSVMNNALADIAQKDVQRDVSLKKAQIKPVHSSRKWAWALGGFALSLCLGGWAVSQQGGFSQQSSLMAAETPEPLAVPIVADSGVSHQIPATDTHSPTSKVVDSPAVTLYSEPVVKAEEITTASSTAAQDIAAKNGAVEAKVATSAGGSTKNNAAKNRVTTNDNATNIVIAKASVKPEQKRALQAAGQQKKQNHSVSGTTVKQAVKPKQAAVPKKTARPQTVVVTESPQEIAQQNTSSKEQQKEQVATMAIEQVELTPQQLASKAIERGKKELDSNNLDGAIKEFETALRYVPTDEQNRKRLAALYYGKSNFRKSVDILQRGIKLNKDSQELRLALSNLLIKEEQPMAALTPLLYLPEPVSIDYLAMRAALAQQLKNGEVAYESYQALVQKEDENARWWLGLAIQQERKFEYQAALHSYQQAMQRVGVSRQTLAFMQERVKLLNSLEGTSGGD